jgi:hypothetical protein
MVDVFVTGMEPFGLYRVMLSVSNPVTEKSEETLKEIICSRMFLKNREERLGLKLFTDFKSVSDRRVCPGFPE